MVTSKSLLLDPMSLGAQAVTGDALDMLDAKGLSHDLSSQGILRAMPSHTGITGRRRSRHDKWRDQRTEVSAPIIAVAIAALIDCSAGKRLSTCSITATTTTLSMLSQRMS